MLPAGSATQRRLRHEFWLMPLGVFGNLSQAIAERLGRDDAQDPLVEL